MSYRHWGEGMHMWYKNLWSFRLEVSSTSCYTGQIWFFLKITLVRSVYVGSGWYTALEQVGSSRFSWICDQKLPIPPIVLLPDLLLWVGGGMEGGSRKEVAFCSRHSQQLTLYFFCDHCGLTFLAQVMHLLMWNFLRFVMFQIYH